MRDPVTLWFEESDSEAASKLMVDEAERLHGLNSARRTKHLRNAKLYANQDLASIYDCGVAQDIGAGVYLSVNITESCINTLTAKMTRTRVRPALMTNKGSRTQQKAAEGGTEFIDGVFQASQLHEAEGAQIFNDGCLFANGWVETLEYGDDIACERVLPDEMLFSETEGMSGMRNLYSLYRRKYVHRQALYRMIIDGKRLSDVPDIRDAIKGATGFDRPGSSWADEPSGGDMIPLYRGWHLPTKKGAGDGRYCVAINGKLLFAKKWERSRFPIDMWQFQRKPTGIYGRSLADQLVPIQYKINEILEQIDEGERLNAVARIFYQDGALDPDDFDNEVGRLIKIQTGHTVDEIKEILGTGASERTYQSLEDWIRRGYEVTGISMTSATAEKPDGITSAVGLREILDREDLRFSDVGKRWERLNRDVGETILDTAAEVTASGRKLVVQVQGDKWAKQVDFAALKLDMAKCKVIVKAASALPTTPAARKQYGEELLDRGAITMARYLEIIDEAGDVGGVTSMVTAVQESIDLDLEDIVDNGKWHAPEKLRDPALARDTALAIYAKSTHEAVPPKNMELLRRYIMLAVKMAGPQGPQAGGAGAQAAAVDPNAAAQAAQAQPGPVVASPVPQPQVVDAASAAAVAPDLAAAAPLPVQPVTPVV